MIGRLCDRSIVYIRRCHAGICHTIWWNYVLNLGGICHTTGWNYVLNLGGICQTIEWNYVLNLSGICHTSGWNMSNHLMELGLKFGWICQTIGFNYILDLGGICHCPSNTLLFCKLIRLVHCFCCETYKGYLQGI